MCRSRFGRAVFAFENETKFNRNCGTKWNHSRLDRWTILPRRSILNSKFRASPFECSRNRERERERVSPLSVMKGDFSTSGVRPIARELAAFLFFFFFAVFTVRLIIRRETNKRHYTDSRSCLLIIMYANPASECRERRVLIKYLPNGSRAAGRSSSTRE